MTPPRDPDEVEQTLLPGAPAKPTPTADTPAHPITTDAPLHPPAAPAHEETLPPPTATPGTIRFPARTVKSANSTVNPTAPGEPDATLLSACTAAPAKGAKSTAAPDGGEATLLLPPPTAPAALHDLPGAPTDPTEATLDPNATLDSAAPDEDSATQPGSIRSGPGAHPAPPVTGTMVGRFALKDLHAAGGLGEVFTARDTELNREVAVKRIKSRYADDPGSRSRFLSEATLTARLDHPGVVPVFGLVNDVRGRPCYAMRFIRGETLKDEIDRYHGAEGSRVRGQGSEKTDKAGSTGTSADGSAPAPEGAPAEVPRSVAFRHLLARFIATCQAIAYAHKKNIIHRDIKPANVMVGSFGETLVVDWGLAKALDDGPDFDRLVRAAAEVGFRHDPDATDLPSHMTHAGTAVGTPAYMAPEQAAGDIHNVGPRADVYALGATLFVILTGKPPVAGKSTNEVLDRVRRGAFEPAAMVNPECPKPLDAIARKAMALRQEDRYATALELAADVERWLSDEPVSCYRDPAPARLARWARHHPARVATSVSLLLASVVAALAIAVVYRQGERRERAEQQRTALALADVTKQEKKTAEALVEVQRERDNVVKQKQQTEEQRTRAEALGKVATGRYDRAVAAYNVLVTDIDKKLADRVGMEGLRKNLLRNATDGLKQLIADEGQGAFADRTLVAAYRQMGEVYQRLGASAQAREHLELAVAQARRVKSEIEKAPVTATTMADERAAARDLGRSLDRLAGVLMDTGKSDAALKAINEAIELFAVLTADRTDTEARADLAKALARRSVILMERGAADRALADCVTALTARRALAPPERTANATPAELERTRALADSLAALAELLPQINRAEIKSADPEVQRLLLDRDEALKSARAALAIRTALAELFPDHPELPRERAAAHALVGAIYLDRGHVTAAAAEFATGLEQLTALLKKDEGSAGTRADLALVYGLLGGAQVRLGEIEEALANTKSGLDFALALQKADPASTRAQRDLALAHERYGAALVAGGRFGAGFDEFVASEKLLRPLRDSDPESTRAQLELARGLERLGDGYLAKLDPAGAVGPFESSAEIRAAVTEKDPHSAGARRDLAQGLYKLAEAHCGTGAQSKAAGPAVRATDLFVALAQDNPASAQAQRDVALAYGKWGQVLSASGRPTGALIVGQSSLARCEKLVKVDEKNVQALEDEAAAWERLATFYTAVGNQNRALAASRAAVEKWNAITKGVDAKTRAGRRRLALAMLRVGDLSTEVHQFRAAADWYKRAADEAKSAPGDLLLAPVAKRAADQLVYLAAVEAGLTNPKTVLTFPEHVRVPALRTVGMLALRAGDTTTAYVSATELAKIASVPADKFAAARALAGCAGTRTGTEKVKKEYAEEAVAQLKAAIAAGFRTADALSDPEWEAVRERVKEFAAVQKELEKLQADGK